MVNITREMQIEELTKRVPPVLNVDVVIYHKGKYLIGKRNQAHLDHDPRLKNQYQYWLFPGGRMSFEETPQETAERILKNEVPGVKATLRKLITALPDLNIDFRSRNVTLFYLFEYVNGNPRSNHQLEEFLWVTPDEIQNVPQINPGIIKILNEIDTAVRTMNTSEDELLVEYNIKGKPIGTIIKRDAHSNPNRYHAAAHIAIFNHKGEIILQQRSYTKNTSPGKWDIHGGHQAVGHTINQTAVNELAEELGIQTKLTLDSVNVLRKPEQSEFAYLFWGVHDGPYGFDHNEVQQLHTFDCQRLLDHEYDEEFSILPHVYDYVKKLEHIWEHLEKNHYE